MDYLLGKALTRCAGNGLGLTGDGSFMRALERGSRFDEEGGGVTSLHDPHHHCSIGRRRSSLPAPVEVGPVTTVASASLGIGIEQGRATATPRPSHELGDRIDLIVMATVWKGPHLIAQG